jgi:hypothetical protein
MNYAQATEIVNQLPRVLIPSDPCKLREVFEALVFLDGHHIAERAARFFRDFAPAYRDSDLTGEDLSHRLTMDVFQDSVIGYLEEKSADVEVSVEHDVATWIEANAPAVAESNLALMESALAGDSAYAEDDRIALRRNIDFDAWAAEQQRVLSETWAGIETDVAAFPRTR